MYHLNALFIVPEFLGDKVVAAYQIGTYADFVDASYARQMNAVCPDPLVESIAKALESAYKEPCRIKYQIGLAAKDTGLCIGT